MVSMDFNNKEYKHFRQATNYDCGAVAYKQLLSILGTEISDPQARQECKTKKSGTHEFNVLDALHKRFLDKEINIFSLGVSFKDYYHYLDLLSQSNIVYLIGTYFQNPKGGGRGRSRKNTHICCVYKGIIYDPSESYSIPIESYFHVFHKDLIIRRIILVDNSGWKI